MQQRAVHNRGIQPVATAAEGSNELVEKQRNTVREFSFGRQRQRPPGDLVPAAPDQLDAVQFDKLLQHGGVMLRLRAEGC